MPTFILNKVAFMKANLPPTQSYLFSVIKENNDNAILVDDPVTGECKLMCDNKPRDLPMFGVYWEEIKEEDKL